jgi:predicted dehydrogenase
MTDAVRIGIVGAGAIAQVAHLPVVAKMRGAQLVAICDNDRPKARALASSTSWMLS